MRLCVALLSLIALFSQSQLLWAQGVLVNITPEVRVALPRPVVLHVSNPRPIPPSSYKIKELAVQVKLADQIARTNVSQSFVNTGSVQMEVCFVFPLPYDGAIDQLTLMVDGKEIPAKLLSAEEARKTYESIVRKNQDPALLEWLGAGMFKTSVFPVPPGAERKVTLRYSQLCRKDQGLTDFLFPLSTAKYTSHPVEKVSFEVSIESAVEIKNVYSPTHPVEIKRPDGKHAVVSLTMTNQVPTSDFRLLYDVGRGEVGASVVSYRPKNDDEGFFLLLASPEIKAADEERPKKNVVFAVDRSGSMSGDKFKQAKNALRFVLNNLREGDLFNIVAYDSQVESFKPELQRYNDDTRAAALGYVEGLYAGGSTNIDGALRASLGHLQDSTRPNFVIFLTDGLPTDGETSEAKIVANAKQNNSVRARIFAFGVGYDVNSRLLDKLVRENFGQSEYVRPNEDIEARVSSLYNRIGSPVMTDLEIKFEFDGVKPEEGPAISRMYPSDPHDLFAGEQLVLVGRYKKSGVAKVVVTGKVGSESRKLDFPVTLVDKSNDETHAFVEKLWAVRRIGEIIDQLDLRGRNEELIKELVQLSTKHGVLTPYTSFLADENVDRRDVAANARRAEDETKSLDKVSGASGVAQRALKGFYQRQAQAAAPALSTSGEYGEAAGGGNLAPGTPLPTGANSYYDAKSDKNVTVTTVQNIGRKTFYRRGQQWIDADVTKEQEREVRKIERFSQEYFDLVAKHGKDVAKYLTIDEPVILEIDGQAYEF